MRYIGIDFGSKRTGVAISDEEGRIAFPHSVIETTRVLANQLKMIAVNEKVHTFVLGRSIDGRMEENPVMKQVHALAKVLIENGEVVYEDERYSSVHATRGHEENAMHDASTAAIILQSYLDRKNHQNSLVENDPYALPKEETFDILEK